MIISYQSLICTMNISELYLILILSEKMQ